MCVLSGSLCSGIHQTEDIRSFLDGPLSQRASTAPPYPRRPSGPGHLIRPAARSGGECGGCFQISCFSPASGGVQLWVDVSCCTNWWLKIFSFLDPQKAVQWQHVRGQVCCVSEGVRGVSSPKLQNTPALRQEQRPGTTGTTAHARFVTSFYCTVP